MIICPLCLEDIQLQTDFLICCRRHKGKNGVFRYTGARDDLERLRCSLDERCNQPQEMWAGVFLAHRGCPVKNPFWDGAKVSASGNRRLVENGRGELVRVEDPQLDLLEELSLQYPDQPEMWFPLGLFRAINESEDYGRLVMLAGPKQVGKTVIATMAMSPHSYDSGALSIYEPQTFMSLHSMSGRPVDEAFLAAVYNAAQLRNNLPAGFVAPTGKDEAHIKVVFLAAQRRGGVSDQIKSVFQGAFDLVWKSQQGLRDGPIHPAVAFFDFAGERFSYIERYTLETYAQKMHAVVVIMEAPDLIRFALAANAPESADKPDSIDRACERLCMVPPEVRSCLVVTKLDLIPEAQLGADAASYLKELESAEDAKLDSRPKQMLRNWLNSRVPAEKKLAGLLDSSKDMPVFFVETLNLTGSTLSSNGQMPRSIGLQRLMLWILERLPRK